MLFRFYGISSEEARLLTQRQYDDLLNYIPANINYETSGKLEDYKITEKKDRENLAWVRSLKQK